MADRGLAPLDAPVALVNLLMGKEIPLPGRVVQVQLHVLVKAPLVAFQRQRVVASLRHDGRRRAALRVHRVRRYHLALHVDQLQEFRQRRDLVRLAVHLHLRQRQLRLRREGLHQVQRRALRRVLERPAQRLAVHRHHVAQGVRPVLRQAQQRRAEARRVQRVEQVREGVVARRAVLELHETAQERPGDARVVAHVDAGAASAQHRQQRDGQHLAQVVARGVAAPGVLNVLKNGQNIQHPDSPLLDRQAESDASPPSSEPPESKSDCPGSCGA